jgi:hypothetical protein
MLLNILIIILVIELLSKLVIRFIANRYENRREVLEIYRTLTALDIGNSYRIGSTDYKVADVVRTAKKILFFKMYEEYRVILDSENSKCEIVIRNHMGEKNPFPYLSMGFTETIKNIENTQTIGLYWSRKKFSANPFLENVEKRSELYGILKEIIDNGVILTHSRLEKEYVVENGNND